MSSSFSTLKLWEAKDAAEPGFGDAINKIENSASLKLDYCIAKRFSKRRTDVTGVQSDEDVHPDTGGGGAFVEIQVTLDRTTATPSLLIPLMRWYGTININSDFKRGFLGLENADNPELDLIPGDKLGYRLVDFAQVDPNDNHGRQVYQILLQHGGRMLDMPIFAPGP